MSPLWRIVPAACLLASGGVVAADLPLDCAAAKDTSISTDADPAFALDELLSSDALGDKGCNTPLCKDVLTWRRDLHGAADEALPSLQEQGVKLLALIYASFRRLPDVPGVTAKARKVFADWNLKTLGASGHDIDRMSNATWQLTGHKLFSGEPFEIDFDTLYAQACKDRVGNCADVFVGGTCVLAHAKLQREVLEGFLRDNQKAFQRHLKGLDDRWQAYRTDGRSLYPWEIAVNEWWWWDYERAEGFSEPPRSQLVFLHPDVVLGYSDDADDHLEEAVVLEVLGYDRWSYGSSGLRQWLGVSAIAAWEGEEDRTSWGLMTHWRPNLAVGVAYGKENGDERVLVLISADLGKLLTKAGKVRKELLESVVGE